MTEADERNLREYLLSLCLAVKLDDKQDQMMREAIDAVVVLVKGMQNEEAALWKGRCEAAHQAHEATIKHMEDEERRDW